MKDKLGYGQSSRFPVGAVRIRTRHGRGGVRRAFIKVAEPNRWELRARIVWEQVNGPIPPRMGVHHKDEDTLNDAIGNLCLTTKAAHLAIHRPASRAKAIASFAKARRKLRWSTKSDTKLCGRHPKNCRCEIHAT